LSVICFSFCGYYIVCNLFFFLWQQYNSHRKKNK
jgi:hypothetical protein